ncbi:LysR family transcriptional regulator [Ramlibacter sp. USB13]|uniref:LysR family transcriptional regulator n=1 Tax=Ramlibacter cellulosilyticus TaxID=2764187 RepID=A0A923MSV3_9BURK|nr:LysR family transcriptional regulator [Ramlibacter cellulosilyticus]MBC5784613.1 LysR family transcriptional regulator [Ramlibacter cellulosilyticus]
MPDSASALLNRLLARGKFRHVQVLLHLAELGSVQRTADAIGMTQSSVTQTLAYLEDLLEVKLFERHARGVRPTPACADLLPVARQMMMGIADSAEIVAARQKLGEGVVRMVASAAAINGLLVDALPEFSARAPGIQVQLREAEGEDQLLAIARGEVDLVACRRPPVIPEGWEFHAVREDRFAIICRAEHPLARTRRVVPWAELGQQGWLLLPTGLAARARFDQLAQQFPAPPRTHSIVTRALPMVVWLLRRENLLALLPLNLARPLIESGLLAEVRTAQLGPMEAIGVLQPQDGRGEAAGRLGEFLRARKPTKGAAR